MMLKVLDSIAADDEPVTDQLIDLVDGFSVPEVRKSEQTVPRSVVHAVQNMMSMQVIAALFADVGIPNSSWAFEKYRRLLVKALYSEFKRDPLFLSWVGSIYQRYVPLDETYRRLIKRCD